MRRTRHALLAAGTLLLAGAGRAATLVNAIAVPNTADLSGYATPGQNRLGGFGSDLAYNPADGLYYAVTDRGPGGGVLSYAPRVQTFSLSTDHATGAIGNFQLTSTVVFKRPDGTPFDGLNPRLLGGSAATLGNALDSEGLAILPGGNLLVSDEYGPSVAEFKPDGTFVRAFATPANLVPRQANGTVNYVDGRPTITQGRQDNRGFEGLTLSPDGKTAYAILQDPLVDEGASPGGNADGRYSRNVRIVAFDVATGQPGAQYIYQLDALADVNARTGTPFDANSQGRSLGVSALMALGDGKFLVLERDNRGLSTDPTVSTDAAAKRAYLVDLTGATDVRDLGLAGRNGLPAGVVPVAKLATPTVDILATLRAQGLTVPEKIEGMTFGERLADGGITLVFATDNDFSVTQNDTGTQFDVCVGGDTRTQVPIGAGCPAGTGLIPTFLYSYRLSAAEYAALAGAVPEAATWMTMVAGFAAIGAALRRRRRPALA